MAISPKNQDPSPGVGIEAVETAGNDEKRYFDLNGFEGARLRKKPRFTSCALLKEESGRKFSEHGSENAFRYQDISFQTCPGHCLGLKINIMNGE